MEYSSIISIYKAKIKKLARVLHNIINPIMNAHAKTLLGWGVHISQEYPQSIPFHQSFQIQLILASAYPLGHRVSCRPMFAPKSDLNVAVPFQT